VRAGVQALLPVDAETAWATLTDWKRQSSWIWDAAEVRVVGSREEGVGTRIAVRTDVLGVPSFTDVLEVTRWQPPTRLVMEHRRFVRGVGTWRLESRDERTVFSWVEEVALPVPILGALALAVYRPVMRTLMRRSMRGLQQALSGGGPQVLPPPRVIA
jgi:Polyketide cyclase / dehydrase and lipid transport